MNSQPKRILFFAEAVTLAHIARCLTLARGLHETGNYTIALAADSRYDSVLGNIPFQRLPLFTVSSDYFFSQLTKGVPLYDVKTLTAYVKEDIKRIEQFRPDFIFGDFRLSLAISSRLKKIPYATITNAYWSPYLDIKFPIPELMLTKLVGVRLAQALFNWFKPFVFVIHSLPLNRTCKKFGQPTPGYDMRKCYTFADITLYADIESLFTMQPYPENHYFIGPILWSADVSLPSWWKNIPEDKPRIFITLGSSGDTSVLPVILETLARLDVTVIAITANKQEIRHSFKNIFITSFLPVKNAVKNSDIIICNGGSPMVYQSLLENKVIIGIPGNLDQYLMMSLLIKQPGTLMLRAGKVTQKSVLQTVNKALALLKSKPRHSVVNTYDTIAIVDAIVKKTLQI